MEAQGQGFRVRPGSAFGHAARSQQGPLRRRAGQVHQHTDQQDSVRGGLLELVRDGQHNLDAAIELYERALGADPANASGHFNLGRALAQRGQLDRAIQSYHRAIELAPEDADAHQSLARALVTQKQIAEAIYRYRRTLEIEPDRVGALLDLAWIIATAPNLELRVPAEAVRLAERAVRLTSGANATALDTLAAAYAIAGQNDRAIATAESALRIAMEAGERELAEGIRARVDGYRKASGMERKPVER